MGLKRNNSKSVGLLAIPKEHRMFYDTKGILLAPDKMTELEKWPTALRKIWDDAIDSWI